jgi:hypothetical protein
MSKTNPDFQHIRQTAPSTPSRRGHFDMASQDDLISWMESMSTMPTDHSNTSILKSPLSDEIALAVKCIDEEIALVGPQILLEPDIPIASIGSRANYQVSKHKINHQEFKEMISKQFRALRWRFRIQESFFHAAELLDSCKLVSISEALRFPIHWTKIRPGVEDIYFVLRRFKVVGSALPIVPLTPLGIFKHPLIGLR